MEENKELSGVDLVKHQHLVNLLVGICSDELNELYKRINPKYFFDRYYFMDWYVKHLGIQRDIPIGFKVAHIVSKLGYIPSQGIEAHTVYDTGRVLGILMDLYALYVEVIMAYEIPVSEIYNR